jgi:hypothetical protein
MKPLLIGHHKEAVSLCLNVKESSPALSLFLYQRTDR